MFFQILLLSLMLVFFYLTLKGRVNIVYFFSLLFISLIGIRWGDFYVNSIQSDEDQWMFCARSMVNQFSEWIHYFVLYDFNRILTILPLSFISLFTDDLSYGHARFVFQFMFLLFLIFQFRLISGLFSRGAALLSVFLIFVVFSLSNHLDFIVYNSEMPVVVIFSVVGFYMYKLLLVDGFDHSWKYAMLAICITLMPFAKEQSLYLSLYTFSFALIIVYFRFGLRSSLWFLSGGLLVSIVIFGWLIGQFGIDRLSWYFGLIIDYSNNGLKIQSGTHNLNLIRFLRLIVVHFELIFLSTPCLVGLIIMLIRRKGTQNLGIFKWFYLGSMLIVIYSVFKPHNYFLHYCILLFPFYLFYAAYLFDFLSNTNRYFYMIAATFFCFAIPMTRFLFKHKRDSDAFHQNSAELSKLSNEVAYSFLKANLHEDDFLVWGWATSYYNEFPVQRVSGFIYPQFNMGYFVGKKVTNQLTVSELNNHKTKYIVELVGSERPYFKSRKEQGIDKVDSLLSKYIADHYRVIIDSMDTRIFVRNENPDVN